MNIGKFTDYVPFLSTVTNVKKLRDNSKKIDQKVDETATLLKKTEPVQNDSKLEGINARPLTKGEIVRSVIATFPFLGNLVVAIYDLGKHLISPSNQPAILENPPRIVEKSQKNEIEIKIEQKLQAMDSSDSFYKNKTPKLNELIKEFVTNNLINSDDEKKKYILKQLDLFNNAQEPVRLEALIRLGLTKEHLDNDQDLEAELARLLYNKREPLQRGIRYGETDKEEMKTNLRELFNRRWEFVNKWK